jgi:hypothetical protein
MLLSADGWDGISVMEGHCCNSAGPYLVGDFLRSSFLLIICETLIQILALKNNFPEALLSGKWHHAHGFFRSGFLQSTGYVVVSQRRPLAYRYAGSSLSRAGYPIKQMTVESSFVSPSLFWHRGKTWSEVSSEVAGVREEVRT